MSEPGDFNPDYVIHTDEEPRRLERQARLYDVDDDLRFAAVGANDRVLDAGCGSGYYARAFGRSGTRAEVVGVDRDERYLDFARRQAQAEGLDHVRFEKGDVLKLPFPDGHFDLVWSKHLLQWVPQREQALTEFRRVTRPGGRIVAVNFDRFTQIHEPVDPEAQADLERWMKAARERLGFDCDMGRRLPAMFRRAGLTDIRVDIRPDRAFTGFGGDPERLWNWQQQWKGAMPFTEQVFGSREAAEAMTRRCLTRLNDPDTFVYCPLFYVEGRVPG